MIRHKNVVMYPPFFVSSCQKMKKIVAGILLGVKVTVTAQPVYEVFAVNEKYGIVNTTDFSTLVVPSYPLFDAFYQDCLALGDGTACYFFDKTFDDENEVQLQSLENKENYIFKLDFANKRVLLPKTYLNQLHITFL